MKTTAQRVAELRQRRKELGLVRLELYVHPDDRLPIIVVAQSMAEERQRRVDEAEERRLNNPKG
jgi:hypothetical protein